MKRVTLKWLQDQSTYNIACSEGQQFFIYHWGRNGRPTIEEVVGHCTDRGKFNYARFVLNRAANEWGYGEDLVAESPLNRYMIYKLLTNKDGMGCGCRRYVSWTYTTEALFHNKREFNWVIDLYKLKKPI